MSFLENALVENVNLDNASFTSKYMNIDKALSFPTFLANLKLVDCGFELLTPLVEYFAVLAEPSVYEQCCEHFRY